MRLLLLFFPLCLIVAAFVVPAKNAGSGVYDIVNDIHNMNRSDSAELLQVNRATQRFDFGRSQKRTSKEQYFKIQGDERPSNNRGYQRPG